MDMIAFIVCLLLHRFAESLVYSTVQQLTPEGIIPVVLLNEVVQPTAHHLEDNIADLSQ